MASQRYRFPLFVLLCVLPLAAQIAQQPPLAPLTVRIDNPNVTLGDRMLSRVCFDIAGNRDAAAKTILYRAVKDKRAATALKKGPNASQLCVNITELGQQTFYITDYDNSENAIAVSDPLVINPLRKLDVTVITPLSNSPHPKVVVERDQPTPTVCFKIAGDRTGAAATTLYRFGENGEYLTEVDKKPAVDEICVGVAVEGQHEFQIWDVDATDQPIASSPRLTVDVTTNMPVVENGIAVGHSKLFDDRSLRTMYDDVQRALTANQFLSLANVTAALGKFQGGVEDKSFVGLNATTLPIPSFEQTTTATDTGTAGTQTTTVADTTAGTTTTSQTAIPRIDTVRTTQEKTVQAAASPNTVTASNPNATMTFGPTFGQSAQDLLIEQTDLAAQAINLRLLLQRALSDRALLYSGGSAPRLTPVLGFQISIDPLRKYRNAVAEAIVTVSSRWSGQRYTPEIVALLPREKTYNVARVMNKASAFSLGAVVQIVNLGANVTRSRNTVYVVKDTDTVALERIPASDPSPTAFGNVEFGWQFRPVLGERSVAPGIRQVFAVLALPSSANEDWGGIVRVHTRWRRFDAKSKTVGAPIDGSDTWQEPYFVSVPHFNAQSRAVAARIDDLEWHDNGGGKAVVTLDGSFPFGTRMTVADAIIETAADGMILRTDSRISISVPIEKLVLGPPTLVDPFGVATVIRHPDAAPTDSLEIAEIRSEKEGKDQLKVTVDVRLPPRPNMMMSNVLPSPRMLRQPVVFVGKNVYALSTGTLVVGPPRTEGNVGAIPLVFTTPIVDAQASARVRVIDLLYGDGKLAEAVLPIPTDAKKPVPTELQVLSSTDDQVVLALIGKNFEDGTAMSLRIGKAEIKPDSDLKTATFRQFTVKTTDLLEARRAVVTIAGGEPTLFAIPNLATDRPKIIRQEPIREGDVRRIRLDGLQLKSVTKIEYNGNELKVTPTEDGDPTVIFVDLTAALTAVPGEKDIDLITEKSRVPGRLFVEAKPREKEK